MTDSISPPNSRTPPVVECRRQADASRKLADEATLENVRQQRLAAAIRWDHLADQAQKGDDFRAAKREEVERLKG